VFGGPGAAEGGLQEPTGLVVDKAGAALVLDAKNAAIHQYDPAGRFVGRVPLERSDFYNPRGLAIDEDDNLYVADTGLNRIVKFSPAGKLLTIVGGVKGAGPGQMLEPTDAAPLSNGELLVLDTGNKRLQWFDATGRYRAEWPISWSVPLNGPHLAIDGTGRVMVTDPERGRIVRYDAESGTMAATGPQDRFRLPVGIAAIGPDRFAIVDTLGNSVTLVELAD
jgi:DNA-binding beta-propeller fold protein YncE